jgi:hypothetical protein
MKYICLVYLVENDMNAMSKKEADACVEESLAYDDVSGRPATSSAPTRYSQTREQPRSGCGTASCPASGFLLIEARHLTEAIQVAARIPMARRGSIEVRPIKELRP